MAPGRVQVCSGSTFPLSRSIRPGGLQPDSRLIRAAARAGSPRLRLWRGPLGPGANYDSESEVQRRRPSAPSQPASPGESSRPMQRSRVCHFCQQWDIQEALRRMYTMNFMSWWCASRTAATRTRVSSCRITCAGRVPMARRTARGGGRRLILRVVVQARQRVLAARQGWVRTRGQQPRHGGQLAVGLQRHQRGPSGTNVGQ